MSAVSASFNTKENDIRSPCESDLQLLCTNCLKCHGCISLTQLWADLQLLHRSGHFPTTTATWSCFLTTTCFHRSQLLLRALRFHIWMTGWFPVCHTITCVLHSPSNKSATLCPENCVWHPCNETVGVFSPSEAHLMSYYLLHVNTSTQFFSK